MEQAALARSAEDGSAAADAELDRLVDDLWPAHAEIALAARSEPLRGTAYRYAARLASAATGGIFDGSALRGPQAQFFDAAYGDMWPGHRRAAGDSVTPQ